MACGLQSAGDDNRLVERIRAAHEDPPAAKGAPGYVASRSSRPWPEGFFRKMERVERAIQARKGDSRAVTQADLDQVYESRDVSRIFEQTSNRGKYRG